MAFTREALHLRWSNETIERAYIVRFNPNYSGESASQPKQVARHFEDGSALVNRGYKARVWMGEVFADDTSPGSTDGITRGTLDELEEAFHADDLEVLSFGDSLYWDALGVGQWLPRLFRPMGDLWVVPLQFIEKTP